MLAQKLNINIIIHSFWFLFIFKQCLSFQEKEMEMEITAIIKLRREKQTLTKETF